MLKRLVLIAALSVLFVPLSHAGIHFGASVGDASYDASEDGFDFNESDFAWKGYVGWRFIRFFGLEAAYVDFGSPEDSDVELDAAAWNLAAVGVLPLGSHFEIFAKAGYYAWDADVKASGLSDSADDSDFFYGAGVEIILGEHIGIRGEYEIYQPEDSDVEVDLDMATVGINIRL